MTKNPLINALIAAAYIVLVVSFISFTENLPDLESSLVGPMTMLSMLTLSASVMAFTFFYQPVVMISKGEHSAAFKLLAQTIGSFAAITAILIAALFSGIFF